MNAGIPKRIARLPVQGAYHIPWFVNQSQDPVDFRIVDKRKLRMAVDHHLCWVCGKHLGGWKSFVLGPMCLISRLSSEPPCHRDCAVYSATVCPFLVHPNMVRRERNLPADYIDPPGEMILRNPGVALVWTTRQFTIEKVGKGVLFDIGDPGTAPPLWFCRGRVATRNEVIESIRSGLPALREEARKNNAVEQVERAIVDAAAYLPVA